ncbi:MAG: MBL fold metallo-hydrolase [Clostridia bacterium]|nr:MBL fold metallo-hydrolase [Clostridia bacterium]
MGRVAILDAGRADCIVIMPESGGLPVVIDGGTTEYNGRPVLADFLNEHGIGRIGLLVITHLHPDHFGGFYNLLEGIEVEEAILPCGEIKWNPRLFEDYGKAEFYGEYEQIRSFLSSRAGRVSLSTDWVNKSYDLGGGALLRCLFPRPDTPDTIPGRIAGISDPNIPEQELGECFRRFMATCNGESTVWALEDCNGETSVLLCADCTEQNLAQILPLPGGAPQVLKLSHHGINNGAGYFSKEQVELMAPKKYIVVCNAKEYYNVIKDDCEALCADKNVKLYYTFQGDFLYDYCECAQ